MDIFSAMSISASGLDAQRTRMNAISSNLANAQSTRTEEGGAYRRRDVVFTAQPASNLQPAGAPFAAALGSAMGRGVSEVRVSEIVEDDRPAREVYSPGHPDADEKGIVRYPNVSVIEEMVNMIAATRSYEANVTAMNAAKGMALKALEIGR
ncbi:MAG: flagellar basal body rod protein FlgC [Nitrospirae bacterium]|nr:flagellar basal body rod protein FlgC [Nitrospirota bacterium]